MPAFVGEIDLRGDVMCEEGKGEELMVASGPLPAMATQNGNRSEIVVLCTETTNSKKNADFRKTSVLGGELPQIEIGSGAWIRTKGQNSEK